MDTEAILLVGGCICFLIVSCVLVGDVLNIVNNDTIFLGDEVVTSDEYNVYFNDSFSGRIITTEGSMYTVRDMEGNERVFEIKWIVRVNQE